MPFRAFICGKNKVFETGFLARFLMASKTNPFTFLQQVRTEVSKVTWPTRGETVTTTIMVFIMVAFASLFFFVIDQLLGWGVGALLSLGG